MSFSWGGLLRQVGRPALPAAWGRGWGRSSAARTIRGHSFGRSRVIRVELLRVALGPAGTPSAVLRVLRDDPRPFLLVGDWLGGGAIASSTPVDGVRPLTPRVTPPGEGS